MRRFRFTLSAGAAALLAGCASTDTPASLRQATDIYQQVSRAPMAQERVGGELRAAQEAINDAQIAVSRNRNQEYVSGLSHIALRAAQTAMAEYEGRRARAAVDSLREVRLARLLTLSEAQRANLLQEQQLSQQEIEALRARNLLVTAEASAQRERAELEAQRADSLRRLNEQLSRQLQDSLTRLRALVVEITNIRETSRGLVIDLSDVLFDVDKATLKLGAEQNLQRIATILNQYPDYQISVEGHTDATGTDAYNRQLSERRAAAVREALVRGGVTAGRISSQGLGEAQPRATNDTPAGRQLNRRVEVIVLGAGTVADATQTRDTTTMPRDTTPAQPPR